MSETTVATVVTDDPPVEVPPVEAPPAEPAPAATPTPEHPPVSAWWLGDPDARALGERALRKLRRLSKTQPSIRRAVELVQKKWGVTPTTTLSAEQWDRLLTEAGLTEDDDTEGDPDDD